jgi:predicted nucleic acid-binding protein
LLSSKGHCSELLDSWRNGQFDVAVCRAFVAELRRVLGYPRIVHKYNIDSDVAAAVLAEVRDQGEQFADSVDPPRLVPGDENDDYIFALAEAGSASLVVTRDKHFDEADAALLTAEIVTPEAFLRRLRDSDALNEARGGDSATD